MKRFLLCLVFVLVTILPVSAMEAEPPEVPESGELYMPENTESFGEALWHIFKTAVSTLSPEIASVAKLCLGLSAVIVLSCICKNVPGSSGQAIGLCSAVMMGIMLLSPTGALIRLGVETITEMAEYGKLLIPVLTAALAAQGSDPLDAARLGVYLHGLAGDEAAKKKGRYGMTASDIAEALPAVMSAL